MEGDLKWELWQRKYVEEMVVNGFKPIVTLVFFVIIKASRNNSSIETPLLKMYQGYQ
jgi:hypothetical protein